MQIFDTKKRNLTAIEQKNALAILKNRKMYANMSIPLTNFLLTFFRLKMIDTIDKFGFNLFRKEFKHRIYKL